MADNIFADLDPDAGGTAPQPVQPDAFKPEAAAPNIFDDINPDTQPETQTSAVGAFEHAAGRNVLPAAAGLVGAGAGAEAGGAVGAGVGAGVGAFFGGVGAAPGAVIGGVGGSIIGGLAGAFGASTVTANVQGAALHSLPNDWQDALGQSDRQQQLDEQYHPTASFLGGAVPYLLTMKPGGWKSVAALPVNATTFQKIAANPLTAHLFGGALMGGMEAGQEIGSGQKPNWTNIAISTGMGLVFNEPNRVGERLTEVGAAPVRRVTGAPEPVAHAAPAEPVPTVAQADDAGVLGAGATEETFMGSHQRAPEAQMAAQDAARTEQSLIGPVAPTKSPVEVARQHEPELFTNYDALTAQRDDLAAHITLVEATAPEQVPALQTHLAATEKALSEIAPDVQAAYRRAADRVGSATIEPEAVAPQPTPEAPVAQPNAPEAPVTGQEVAPVAPVEKGGPVPASTQEMSVAIAADMTRKLIAAGQSPELAAAHGQLIAAHYIAKAPRFGGARGSALDLYRQEGPIVKGYGRAAQAIEPPTKAPLMPTAEEPNFPARTQALAQPVPAVSEAAPAPAPASVANNGIEALDPKSIGVDAQRFQFKEGGDESGVTERLQGVEKWDPRLAGTALVWRDGEGKNWIADGHQRLALANRLTDAGQPDIRLNAFVLNSADGVTDAHARAIAAAKNIAEGTGSAVDAAKILRAAKDDGVDLPPLPPRSALVRDGKALAELSPDAFGMVVNEVVPATQGAMVGRLVKDPQEQVEAIRLLTQAKPENAQQAEMIVRDMLGSGTEQMTRQDSLFGAEAFASSIVLERAKVADEAIKQLRKDKATFNTLVNEAERIQGAGENVLDQAANTSRLTTDEKASDLLTQLAFRAGPVSDALSAVARRLKFGDIKPSEAAREFLGVVRSAVESGVDTGADVGRPEPGAAGQREDLATEPGAEGLPQTLLPGVAPVTDLERANLEAAKPLQGGNAAPGGLFDEDAQNQQSLFQGKRGSITFAPGKKPIIKLFAEANASTFLHETGHQWLEELMRDAKHPAANDSLKNDAQTVSDWLGMEEAGAPIKTAQHEKFARGFEQYMREGVAPSPGLASVFAKFKSWLTQIYQSIKGLGLPINEDMRGVFDRMLAEEPNRTVIAPEREGSQSLASLHELDAEHTHPAEAGAARDRVVAERDSDLTTKPPEVQNEIAAAQERIAATDAAAANSGAEGNAGPNGPEQLAAGGGGPVAEPAGGGGSGEPGAVVSGGAEAKPQGAGVGSGGATGGGNAAAPDAGLRGERPEPAVGAGAQSGNPIAPSPSTVFPAEPSKFTDRAGNIVIGNLTTSEDVAQAIRDSAKENNDFIGDRRGVITDSQVLDLADALGMDAGKLNQRHLGQAFNAEQIMAARKLLVQSATNLSGLMKKAATGTDEDVMAYAEAKDRHQMIQAQVAGITAEAGRALRAFRNITGQIPGMEEFIKAATGKTLFQLKAEAALGAKLETPEQVSKFMNDAQKRTFGDMLLEYWVNGLISGPQTHVTYMIGNTLLSLQRAGPETLAAAAIGLLRQKTGREGNIVRFGEVPAQLKAAITQAPAALKGGAEAVRTGVTTLLPGEKPRSLPFQPSTELAPAAWLDENYKLSQVLPDLYGSMQGILDGITATGKLVGEGGVQGAPAIGAKFSPLGAIPDIQIHGVTALPLGTLARLPSRGIAAIHSFQRITNYSMAKAADAYRTAVNEGLTGTARDARIADLIQNPTPEMMERTRTSATDATLMGKGSEFVQALSNLTNTRIFGFPFLKFVDPFVHIAGSILDQSLVKRTPLGLLSGELRADLTGKNGTIAQDTAQGRMLVGTAMALGFGTLAAKGLMSGSGPSDPDKSAMWRLAGNQAHSIRIGDTWYDVHRLGPMGMLASVAADMYDVAHSASDGDMTAAGGALLHAFTQTTLDEGFMSGPSQLIQALTDPGRYGAAYVRNQISSFVPYSVAMSQMARASDPYSRQARSIMDAIKAKIPGQSELLMPRVDLWGQPVMNPRGIGGANITSIYGVQASRDPVNLAMLQLGIGPAAVRRDIRGVQLNDQQYNEYATLAGRMLKSRLDTIIGSPDWRTFDPATQVDVINATIAQSREVARGTMMARHPDIAVAATRLKLSPLQKRPIQ